MAGAPSACGRPASECAQFASQALSALQYDGPRTSGFAAFEGLFEVGTKPPGGKACFTVSYKCIAPFSFSFFLLGEANWGAAKWILGPRSCVKLTPNQHTYRTPPCQDSSIAGGLRIELSLSLYIYIYRERD